METIKNKLEELKSEVVAGYFALKLANLIEELENKSITKSQFLLKLHIIFSELQLAPFRIKKSELYSIINEIKHS